MRYLPLSLIVVMATLLASCEQTTKKGDAPHQYADFFVRYLSGEGQIKATASFLEGEEVKSAKPVALESGIKFQGSEMEERHLPGGMIRYSTEYTGTYTHPFVFKFRDASNHKQEYQIDMNPIEKFSIKNNAASLSKGLELELDSHLGKDENLILFFSDENKQATTVQLKGPISNNTILIQADKIQNFHAAQYELYLVKKKKIVVKDPSLSILGNLEYYTQPIQFQVTPE
ncbi:MAG: hypothetical protein MI974_30325 [Chitinophagales bacterium]|nr:hypothetical protein [Chitinophagales bacterium]